MNRIALIFHLVTEDIDRWEDEKPSENEFLGLDGNR